MASGGEKKRGDFYEVLGLKKECSEAELRNAYKKLAMRWHPDRCSTSGSIEEAKEKFQAIQEAYSVLSDSNKRFLYDAGVHDIDDDEDNSFGDFLDEMAQMMSHNIPTQENGSHETFEELQQLFVDMFQDDLDHGFGDPTSYAPNGCDWFSAAASSGQPYCNSKTSSNKRGNSTMNSGKSVKSGFGDFHSVSAGFCSGSNDSGQSSGGRRGNNSKRRNGRKQKISSKHDVSSRDAQISA